MEPKTNIFHQFNDPTATLNQILENMQTEQFIDPQFEHIYQNIYSRQTPVGQIEQVIWMPCQQLHHKPFYSTGDFTLDQIKSMNFISEKISNTLILMKYLAPQIFTKLIKPRELYYHFKNREFNHLYCFDLFVNKEQQKVFIDSCVPVSQIKNKELFCENAKGCVFPCLIEKLLAKVCNGYQNIDSVRVTDMIEMFTAYVSERVRIKNMFGGIQEDKEQISHLQKLIDSNIYESKNLIFFRTRNNSKLLSFGLKPNHFYFIVGLIDQTVQIDDRLISFLELPEKEVDSMSKLEWIGKFSKHRTESSILVQSQVNSEVKKYENFMSMRDLIKITKQFIILHNTSNYLPSSTIISLTLRKNLSNNYSFQHLSSNNILSQENMNSLRININQGSYRQINPSSVFKKVVLSENDEVNEQILHQTTDGSGRIDDLYLVWEAVNITVFHNQQESKLNKSKILINLRVQWQIKEEVEAQLDRNMFGKVTVIVLEDNRNSILKAINTQPKYSRSRQTFYFDLLLQLTQKELISIKQGIKLILMLNINNKPQKIVIQRMNLKITSFSPLSLTKRPQIYSLTSSQSTNNQVKSTNSTLTLLLKDFLRQMLLTSQENSLIPDQPFSIICRQLIDQFSLGVVYIRLNQHKLSAKSTQFYIVQIQIDTQILLQNGIYLLEKVGSAQDCSLDKNNYLLTYRVKLSQLDQSEFMLVFRINIDQQSNHQSFSEPNHMFQFPPLDSIKISRIFQANL